jgi:hypothetical protein
LILTTRTGWRRRPSSGPFDPIRHAFEIGLREWVAEHRAPLGVEQFHTFGDGRHACAGDRDLARRLGRLFGVDASATTRICALSGGAGMIFSEIGAKVRPALEE